MRNNFDSAALEELRGARDEAVQLLTQCQLALGLATRQRGELQAETQVEAFQRSQQQQEGAPAIVAATR